MSNDPTNVSPGPERPYSPRRAARAARARAEADGWGTHGPLAGQDVPVEAGPAGSTFRAAEAAVAAVAAAAAKEHAEVEAEAEYRAMAAARKRSEADAARKQAAAQAAAERTAAAARRRAAEEKGRQEFEALRAREAVARQVETAAAETARRQAADAARKKAAAEAEEAGRREYEALKAEQARAEAEARRHEAEEAGRREYEAMRERQAAEKQAIAAAAAQRARDEAATAQSEAAERVRQTMQSQRQRQHVVASSGAGGHPLDPEDGPFWLPNGLERVPGQPRDADASVHTGQEHEEPETEASLPAWDGQPEPAGDHPGVDGSFATHGWEAEDYVNHPALGLTEEEAERENVFLSEEPADAVKARKKRRRRRNAIMLAVFGGFIVLVLVAVLFLQSVVERLNPKDFPGPGGAAVSFEVKQGWGPLQIGASLQEKHIVASKKLFVEAVNLVEAESKTIHPGQYELREEMPALAAADILIGQGSEKVGYVAIKQNTRMGGVLGEINTATGIPMAELEKLSVQPAAFGLPEGLKNLEGYLHPGEYRFPLDAKAKTVLELMVDATRRELETQGITDPDEQYRVLKVASILQAEARPDDYAIVAGALENRLHPSNTETNGLLQVDSTVIYGLERYTLQMTAEEKKDASNPYNSYVHKGLPPTPIGSPGNSAIEAAVSPTPNDYYYWVTVDTNTGETKFAKTYAEHQVYQNQFRTWCAANKDVCK